MLKRLKDYDFTLMITPILLAGFGIVMIYSASMVTAVVEGNESTHYLIRQSIWFVVGMIGFIICSIFPYKYYQKLMKFIILFIVILLVAVLIFGNSVNNAKSWFQIGPASMQPAEFAKLGLIMYLASIYSKKQAYISQFNTGVLPPLILTGIILGLIVLQPDIGTASIIFLIACTVIFSSGIRLKHLSILIAIGVGLAILAVPFLVTDERLSRFTGAYQPFATPDSDGYQLIQSYVAIGVGGLTGEGLGQSVQKLGYLVEAHTDFIMAIVAEELGFIGVLIVLGMLAIIVLRGIFIARKCNDSFGALLALGISSMVGIQTFINLGSISGLLPITGVPLPFVSYGGSSLLIMLISMGILNNIASAVKKQEIDGTKEKSNVERKTINYNRSDRRWQN
ncbi:putative lipid II flippase FtsW [Oceanobacillus profundus]|uniref:Probable peptidoglycan glycosyltransferase FtsW n=1 Tax=Oceanobacillus profundus TaxID=372463 RepID=A0A417YKE1_9BACI|nr:putative lipid II flippase FtsW [Oceanobacillus profundus]MBR3119991.1 putative lipid II flippase FtsW [Oceanobacillus sp.]PAE30147.1 putative lipid II flippase FtsW [Paenibacillus sp. 7884-2]MCM3396215.1 putative lipid II flippase FtsW [Oceanobacillus profundus]MDO6449775.1 putative lipid II flippase FtsW [Oceanobacillus profundus]RHW33777.1 putative lipid II flippase FtsW [Oceanobacillus profundus]